MTQIPHFAIYFSAQDLENIKQNSRREPFKSALATLKTMTPDDPIAQAVAGGFRWRLLDDADSAAKTRQLLIEQGAGFNIPDEMPYAEQCAVLMAVGHAFEMVRDDERMADDARMGWLRVYDQQVQARLQTPFEALPLLDAIWRTALAIVSSVVIERHGDLVVASEDFKRIINEQIHPEGYMPAIVQHSEGGALIRQLLAAKGLVLAAEAGTQAGLNLWGYELRGISARTPAIYAAAYYEYRESWRWDTPPDAAENDALYHDHAAFLEMLNRQLRPEILRNTMTKLRPMFDAYGGGMTTLSHGVAQRRGLFGR